METTTHSAAKVESTAQRVSDIETVTNIETANQTESIVYAAERLIRQTGFQKTTVADIARELQMSPANIYRFFASRSEINVAVCRRIFDEI